MTDTLNLVAQSGLSQWLQLSHGARGGGKGLSRQDEEGVTTGYLARRQRSVEVVLHKLPRLPTLHSHV